MKRIKISYILLAAMVLLPSLGHAQQYNGTSGFLHIPSAEMSHEGDARMGVHYLNKALLPDTGFLFQGEKYNTYDFYLGITPFEWIELSFTSTRRKDTRAVTGEVGFWRKDRYASIKIRPLREGRYHPAVAIGFNDVGTTAFNKERTDVQLYFTNIYVAATKHFGFGGNELAVNLAYRHYFRNYNNKWSGLVGGLSFRPAFFPQGRAIVEYTGNEFLIGADALLWQHVRIQASLIDFKYLNLGLCLQLNMLGKKYVVAER